MSGARLGDLPALLASLPRLSADDGERFTDELGGASQSLNANSTG
ncbi:MAG: hypothetical protein ACRELT_11695 [Longimicrobiales bacterium]